MAVTAELNSLWQVVVRGRIENQLTCNVLNFRCISADVDVRLHLILVLITCFVENILPGLSEEYVLEEVRWKQTYPALGVEYIEPFPADSVGGVAGDALPSYCSAVLSIRTLLGGRSHRGRMYIAGIPEASTNGSLILTESVTWTAILNFIICVANNFKPAELGGGGVWVFGVYSRKIGGSTFPYGNAGFTPYAEMAGTKELGTTRSRKIGRGA